MSPEVVIAIIGGIVTITVGCFTYMGSIKGAKLQIEKAQKDLADAKKEEEKLARRFIESFLYQEIKSNLEIIRSITVISFKTKAENKLTRAVPIDDYPFSKEMYDEIRPQLNKINDLVFVSDIMGIYQCFNKINQINKLGIDTNENSKEIYQMLEKWSSKLNVKHPD
ncbi:hypothetical protein [Bacillus cereus]|uniref:hypothetical protein n=1 Tax=Bacillus cereus TaxID=1396 RepID=UPI0007779A8E|nr:hypothetical protein [Bacillus cereus]UUE91498.1 hypothetical protein L2I54_13245 [Bacillus cereus]